MWHCRIPGNQRTGVEFRRRFRDLLRRCTDGEVSLDSVTASAQGWANHARYGNTVGLRKAVLGTAVAAPRLSEEVRDGR